MVIHKWKLFTVLLAMKSLARCADFSRFAGCCAMSSCIVFLYQGLGVSAIRLMLWHRAVRCDHIRLPLLSIRAHKARACGFDLLKRWDFIFFRRDVQLYDPWDGEWLIFECFASCDLICLEYVAGNKKNSS